MKLAGTRLKETPIYKGLTFQSKAGPVWNGKVEKSNHGLFTRPLRWTKPRRIFVNSMSDLFHEALPDGVIDDVFAIMARCPQHTFQVLTKRAERMRRYLNDPRLFDRLDDLLHPHPADMSEPSLLPLPNVWLGVSVESQAMADERIPRLLEARAAVRFISAEPLLERVSFRWAKWAPLINARHLDGMHGLAWVIVGGESGPNARPFNTEWAQEIVEQCREAEVACFVKQLGAHVIQGSERRIKRDKKGGDMSEFPHEIRVREFPSPSLREVERKA